MADIRAFQALRFTGKAGHMEELCCPPYDIISEEQRRAYLQRNPYNIIRLELPRDGENPYEEAGRTLQGWLKNGILCPDDQPAIYVYEITFDTTGMDGCAAPAGQHAIAGLVARVKLEELSSGRIRPHEETLSKAKTDRLNLMRATGCNFSDIYSLYRDEEGAVSTKAILADARKARPLTELTDENGLIHRLWAITDPEKILVIQQKMANTILYIADGHHRYETALNYYRERPDNADAGFVMMMLVEMEDEGLLVLPTHRLLRGLNGFNAEKLLKACEADFRVEPGLPVGQINQRLLAAYHAGEKAFGFYTGGEDFSLLTLRDKRVMDDVLPDSSAASRQLDVNVLHSLILERLLGIDRENMKNQVNLTYTRSLPEALQVVRDGQAQGCFLLNPTRVEEIRDVAAAGEKMPQKSTYFYPKLITGLTINQL